MDSSSLSKQGAYLTLSRITEKHTLSKIDRFNASLLLLEKAVNDGNLE